MKHLTKTLALGAILALQACGSDPAAQNPVGVPAPVPTPIPAPPVQQIPTNVDFVQAYIIPMLQSQYGNLQVMSPVSVPGSNVVIEARSYTWAEMYGRVLAMTQACGCFITNAAMPQGMTNGFVNLNFNDFYVFVGGQSGANFNPWYNVVVTTQSGVQTNFFEIFNLLVSMAYNYYSTYYYNYVYVYGSWPTWNVWPVGNTVGGFINYNSGSGFSINLGGIFNF